MKEKIASNNNGVGLVLTDTLAKIARRELREDHATREQCLAQLRDWILKNEDLCNVRTDDNFLLRFLRARKFSVPMAQQTLLKYLNIRRSFPHLSTELDYLEPRLLELTNSGYIFASPRRDKEGRRVVIINSKGLNPKKFTSADQAKAHFLTYECLMEDLETQVCGITHVGDFSGVTTAHVFNWNPTEFARIFKWGEQSLPIRHKAIHLINVPSAFRWLIDFVKGRVSSKMKNRLTVHSNPKELKKNIDIDCLPLEWGGKIPLQEMIELWKQELAAKREKTIALDKSMLLSDRGIQRKSSYNAEKHPPHYSTHYSNFLMQMDSVEGTFRKLQFD